MGLVRYPTTLAPNIGEKRVVTRCADNAKLSPDNSLSVSCSASGTWSDDNTPVCQCREGYESVWSGGRWICRGIISATPVKV